MGLPEGQAGELDGAAILAVKHLGDRDVERLEGRPEGAGLVAPQIVQPVLRRAVRQVQGRWLLYHLHLPVPHYEHMPTALEGGHQLWCGLLGKSR